MNRASRLRIAIFGFVAILATLAIGSTAVAQVTIGQTAPAGSSTNECGSTTEYDELQPAVAEGASYVVPTAGKISSWSTAAGAGAGQVLTFKVFRRVSTFSFQVIGHDGPRPLTPSVLNTFQTDIPVQPGDFIGVHVSVGVPVVCSFETGLTGDIIAYLAGNAPDGATIEAEEEPNNRLNVAATVLSPPALTAISPASGSVKGGTSVLIAGGNFARVTGVSFGATPAQSFTATSEGAITAVSPSSTTLSSVPVTVTTIAGTATSAQTFTYEGCKVPKLKGSKLKAAKRRSRKADCGIGKVKKLGDATAKSGKVVKQNPKPGKILAPGTKIKVTLKG